MARNISQRTFTLDELLDIINRLEKQERDWCSDYCELNKDNPKTVNARMAHRDLIITGMDRVFRELVG